MKLQEKMRSIRPGQIVSELDQLLVQPTVRISWWGERLVSVPGYEGEVLVQSLKYNYRHANPFTHARNFQIFQQSKSPIQPSPSLKERLLCDQLWDRVELVIDASEKALNQTYLYKYLVPVVDSIGIMSEYGTFREEIFYFTKAEYQGFWPDAPLRRPTTPNRHWHGVWDRDDFPYLATKRMVESALTKLEEAHRQAAWPASDVC